MAHLVIGLVIISRLSCEASRSTDSVRSALNVECADTGLQPKGPASAPTEHVEEMKFASRAVEVALWLDAFPCIVAEYRKQGRLTKSQLKLIQEIMFHEYQGRVLQSVREYDTALQQRLKAPGDGGWFVDMESLYKDIQQEHAEDKKQALGCSNETQYDRIRDNCVALHVQPHLEEARSLAARMLAEIEPRHCIGSAWKFFSWLDEQSGDTLSAEGLCPEGTACRQVSTSAPSWFRAPVLVATAVATKKLQIATMGPAGAAAGGAGEAGALAAWLLGSYNHRAGCAPVECSYLPSLGVCAPDSAYHPDGPVPLDSKGPVPYPERLQYPHRGFKCVKIGRGHWQEKWGMNYEPETMAGKAVLAHIPFAGGGFQGTRCEMELCTPSDFGQKLLGFDIPGQATYNCRRDLFTASFPERVAVYQQATNRSVSPL